VDVRVPDSGITPFFTLFFTFRLGQAFLMVLTSAIVWDMVTHVVPLVFIFYVSHIHAELRLDKIRSDPMSPSKMRL
jgi:hypothetical protein